MTGYLDRNVMGLIAVSVGALLLDVALDAGVSARVAAAIVRLGFDRAPFMSDEYLMG